MFVHSTLPKIRNNPHKQSFDNIFLSSIMHAAWVSDESMEQKEVWSKMNSFSHSLFDFIPLIFVFILVDY